jgi:hypothetical protein
MRLSLRVSYGSIRGLPYVDTILVLFPTQPHTIQVQQISRRMLNEVLAHDWHD